MGVSPKNYKKNIRKLIGNSLEKHDDKNVCQNTSSFLPGISNVQNDGQFSGGHFFTWFTQVFNIQNQTPQNPRKKNDEAIGHIKNLSKPTLFCHHHLFCILNTSKMEGKFEGFLVRHVDLRGKNMTQQFGILKTCLNGPSFDIIIFFVYQIPQKELMLLTTHFADIG